MVPQLEEVFPFSRGNHHVDDLERFNDPIGDLLVQAKVTHGLGTVVSVLGCVEPHEFSKLQCVAFSVLVGLHPRLIQTKLHWGGRVQFDTVSLNVNWNGTTAAGRA